MKNTLIVFLLFVICTSFRGSEFLTVGNLVFNDANGNGIKDFYEPGIGGVTVNLYTDNDNNNIPDGPGSGTVYATTVTASNGSYSFSNLAPGRYIASVVIPTGYTVTPGFSLTPDNDIDNDNNAAILFKAGTEVRSNAITLSNGGEPTYDGDGTEGNLTLDLAVCGQSNIGDFVWFDVNANGLQEDNEMGFANVSVTLIYPDGTTYEKFTDDYGHYSFVNLGPGTHTLKFKTPDGFTASPALVGTNREKDSDPVGGKVVINVLPITNNQSYDAGFYLVKCATTGDTDGDCKADIDDLDDDNDGIIDDVENGGYDALKDCDGDGIVNYRDPTPGCPLRTGTDIYGVPYKPLTWTDCNNDGINDFFDWDRDGVINELDLDSDNDGILDIRESRDPRLKDNNNDGMADGVDQDNDGIMSSADVDDFVYGGPGLMPEDLDRDGHPNYLDLDSDGDGVTDITEALLFVDSDGLANGTNDVDRDGVYTVLYNNNDNSADNFIGFGAKGIRVNDWDDDGYPNPYDIDSDNDGITDNVEAQPTCSEVQPSGIDMDNDGVDDAYDINLNTCKRQSHGLTPYDKDADGTPDMYDNDTDNDGAPDINEGSGIYGEFVTDYNDTDGDGLIDQFDIFNIKTATSLFINNVAHGNMGPNGSLDGPIPAGSNAELPQSKPGDCSTGADRDWRDVTVLPLTMLNFKGQLNGESVHLSWSTTSEINMKQYVVERSVDGISFQPVTTVAAKGSILINTYAIDDDVKAISATKLFYRLRQFDKAATQKLSNTITFTLGKKDKLEMVVYPNPAVDYATLKIDAVKQGNASIRVVDMFGKIVYNQVVKITAGSNTLTLYAVNKFAAGTYTIQLVADGQLLSRKLVVGR